MAIIGFAGRVREAARVFCVAIEQSALLGSDERGAGESESRQMCSVSLVNTVASEDADAALLHPL
jgi:hypothetical protein